MADINAAVKETAQQIRGENAQMFGQFSQGLAQQLGEAVRGMHGAGEQNMQHMLRMLAQEKVERKKQTEETVSALSPGPNHRHHRHVAPLHQRPRGVLRDRALTTQP